MTLRWSTNYLYLRQTSNYFVLHRSDIMKIKLVNFIKKNIKNSHITKRGSRHLVNAAQSPQWRVNSLIIWLIKGNISSRPYLYVWDPLLNTPRLWCQFRGGSKRVAKLQLESILLLLLTLYGKYCPPTEILLLF